MTPFERSGIGNAIWLCGLCADMVDKDVHRFSAELLHDWKRRADDMARMECETHSSAEPDSSRFLQASRILSFGRDLEFPLDRINAADQLDAILKLLARIIKRAFYDTCQRTQHDDFVFLGSFYFSPSQDGKERFAFEMKCHITHFISAFEEMLSTVIGSPPDEWDRRLSKYFGDLYVTAEWRFNELVPYRISRTGPREIDMREAAPIRSIDSPFSTSSLLTLLAHAKTSGLVVLDHIDESEETLKLFNYLASAQDRRTSWDDVILDRANAERFSFPPSLQCGEH